MMDLPPFFRGVRTVGQPTILTDAIGKSLKPAGFKKKADTWFRSTEETVSVLNLQKSDYGRRYYVNVGVWLNCIGHIEFPKEHKCHIRFRWQSLIPQDEKQLERLLNLEDESVSDGERQSEISHLLENYVLPFYASAKTIDGLRQLLKSDQRPVCLVHVMAQEVLKKDA